MISYTNNGKEVYDDNTNSAPKYWPIIVFAISMVIFAGIGIYFIMKFKSYDNITGYVLTTEYVSSYCRKTACLQQGIFSCVASLMMLLTIASEFSKKGRATRAKRAKGIGLVVYMAGTVLICLILIGFPALKTYKVMTNEPEISTAQITDIYERRGRSTSYYFKFSDGSKLSVSRNEYRNANYGDTYYIAYFGGKAVKCFNSYTYSLPE